MNLRIRILLVVSLLALLVACKDDPHKLMQELNERSPVKRAGAVRVLWKYGDKELAYQLLNRALGDTSAVVRVAAVRALGDFSDRDTSAALVRATYDGDPEVRQEAIAALARRRSPLVERTLLDLLENRETDWQLRRRLFQVWRKWEPSGEKLAHRLAEQRLQRIAESWREGSSEHRARLVAEAARLYDGKGSDIVLQALRDPDPLVVQAALRGLSSVVPPQVRQAVLRLSASEVPAIRSLAWRALLTKEASPEIIQAAATALRDQDPGVGPEVLERLVEIGAEFPAAAACQLLRPGYGKQALRVARLLARAGKSCSVQLLLELLEKAKDRLGVLETLVELGPGAAAVWHSAASLDLPQVQLAAAALLGGGATPKQRKLVRGELEKMLRQLPQLLVRWPGKALPPLNEEAPAEQADTLSEQQLRALYGKHQLKLRPESPRSVSDLLAGFTEQTPVVERLFDPLAPLWRRKLALLVRAALRADVGATASVVHRLLASGDEKLAEMALQTAREQGAGFRHLAVELAPDLERLLPTAGPRLAGQLVQMLQQLGTKTPVATIGSVLLQAGWEKREAMLSVLEPPAHPQLVAVLLKLLDGKSETSAAQALARLGARQAIPALRKALTRAGPAEELVLLQALSELGDDSVLERASRLLLHPDPRLRLLAVEVVGKLPNGKARELLVQWAQYDIDAEVRRRARQMLTMGGQVHERDQQKTQGPGGGVDAQGQVRQGAEKSAAGEGNRP